MVTKLKASSLIKATLSALLISAFGAGPASAAPTTETFSFTGSAQTWTVPAGVTSATFDLYGAGGSPLFFAGDGARVQATIPVVPGESLAIYVGGDAMGSAGGFNGGGNSGDFGTQSGGSLGGGGATDIRRGSGVADRLLVAGGGGGNGNGASGDATAGGAGGDSGQPGGSPDGGLSGDGGGAGTSSGGAGGAAGTGGNLGTPSAGTAGALGQGGNGGAAMVGGAGGGGGGGYFGGGGGGGGAYFVNQELMGFAGPGGGGGGGSSLLALGGTVTEGHGSPDSFGGVASVTYEADPPPSSTESDGDGIADPADNCPGAVNSDQADSDGDGTGNACDSTPNGNPGPPPDNDGDGVPNASDSCPTVAAATANGCPAAPAPPPPDGGSVPAPSVVAPKIGGSSSAGSAKVSATGRFTLPGQTVNCTGAGPACSVKTSVTRHVPAGASKRVKLGGSSFKVAAGKKGKVRVKLNRKARRLLKRRRAIKANVVITVRRGEATAKKTVTVKLKAPAVRKKRR